MALHGSGIFSYEQTAGKGQRTKKWLSQKGKNIAFTLILQPDGLNLDDLFALSAAVALGAYQFFSKYAGDETKIKWPNDVYWRDRKAGGILIENTIGVENRISNWKWAIAGVGLNINQTDFDPSLPNPVSLKQITGKEFELKSLVQELRDCILHQYQKLLNKGAVGILKEYNAILFRKNMPVKFKSGKAIFEAVVKEVGLDGRLEIEHSTREKIEFGTLEWIV